MHRQGGQGPSKGAVPGPISGERREGPCNADVLRATEAGIESRKFGVVWCGVVAKDDGEMVVRVVIMVEVTVVVVVKKLHRGKNKRLKQGPKQERKQRK